MKAVGGENERRGIHGKVIEKKTEKKDKTSSKRFRLPLLSKVYDPAGRKFQDNYKCLPTFHDCLSRKECAV